MSECVTKHFTDLAVTRPQRLQGPQYKMDAIPCGRTVERERREAGLDVGNRKGQGQTGSLHSKRQGEPLGLRFLCAAEPNTHQHGQGPRQRCFSNDHSSRQLQSHTVASVPSTTAPKRTRLQSRTAHGRGEFSLDPR
ncbi:hypothetical protein AAFF_G00205780 [Aldrovandia affinis]|uniref:Uncharacterized protein n=1 Tax=Aldrovandia affinis TaxID=143900 RepID=A0AAD7RHT8_9TELE|nr:hypothetical protein AAFF_G00205780 [Aldrovandia affinis]